MLINLLLDLLHGFLFHEDVAIVQSADDKRVLSRFPLLLLVEVLDELNQRRVALDERAGGRHRHRGGVTNQRSSTRTKDS